MESIPYCQSIAQELLSNLGERLANGPSVLHARGLAIPSCICILCDLYLVKAHLIPFEILAYISENIPKLVHLDNGPTRQFITSESKADGRVKVDPLRGS